MRTRQRRRSRSFASPRSPRGAVGAALWRVEADAPPSFLAPHGFNGEAPDHGAGGGGRPGGARRPTAGLSSPVARRAATDRAPAWRRSRSESLRSARCSSTSTPSPTRTRSRSSCRSSARAALALRRSRRVGLIATALRRSQTIIGVVSQAIAQLSLAHTLETAVERIAELTASGHVAVYLREGHRLTAAASRGLEGPHTDLAERLLELALGPFRGRGFLFIEDMRRDPRLKGLEDGWEANGIRRALVVPLIVHDEVIGALAVYKTRARSYREGEESLLLALSSQLAVAVENARLHERTKELGEVLEATLDSERRSTRQLRGLYEISAVLRREPLPRRDARRPSRKTMVQLFDLDAAVIRMPGARGEVLESKAIHVGDPALRETVGTPARAAAADGRAARAAAAPLGPARASPARARPTRQDAHRMLEPFLRPGRNRGRAPARDAGRDPRDADAPLPRPGAAARARRPSTWR